MNMEQWSKEESLLVLDLYLSKPVGMKSVTDETLVDRAQLLGRTPDAFCRRMMQFQQWYPVLPFDAGRMFSGMTIRLSGASILVSPSWRIGRLRHC